MPPNPQRPDSSGRAACARLGASASCLVVILAANQAAARDALAPLPYLAHAAPVALRFAAARPPTPPPPHLSVKPPEAPTSSQDTSPDGALAPDDAAKPSPVPAANPGASPGTVSSPSAGTDPSAAPTSGLPILPDTYARPAPVTVDQLLPYFLPPPAPVSRATYEVK